MKKKNLSIFFTGAMIRENESHLRGPIFHIFTFCYNPDFVGAVTANWG
jgi:hypothetical protein